MKLKQPIIEDRSEDTNDSYRFINTYSLIDVIKKTLPLYQNNENKNMISIAPMPHHTGRHQGMLPYASISPSSSDTSAHLFHSLLD